MLAWPAHMRFRATPPPLAVRTKISLRSGRTPTPILLSCNKPRRNTRDYSDRAFCLSFVPGQLFLNHGQTFPNPGKKTLCVLMREDDSVRAVCSSPSMRPLTIGKVEARFPVRIMESIVHCEGAGCHVELQQIKAGLGACHHNPLRLRIPACPVWREGIAELQPRNLAWLGRIGNIEHSHKPSLPLTSPELKQHGAREGSGHTDHKCDSRDSITSRKRLVLFIADRSGR